MADWQPGDLALCVNTRVVKSGRWIHNGGSHLRCGAVYTVKGVYLCPQTGPLCLALREVVSEGVGGGFAAWRFRKIRPHTPDAEDAETIRLLTGKPVPEPMGQRTFHREERPDVSRRGGA
jgi:hypothetical protein